MKYVSWRTSRLYLLLLPFSTVLHSMDYKVVIDDKGHCEVVRNEAPIPIAPPLEPIEYKYRSYPPAPIPFSLESIARLEALTGKPATEYRALSKAFADAADINSDNESTTGEPVDPSLFDDAFLVDSGDESLFADTSLDAVLKEYKEKGSPPSSPTFDFDQKSWDQALKEYKEKGSPVIKYRSLLGEALDKEVDESIDEALLGVDASFAIRAPKKNQKIKKKHQRSGFPAGTLIFTPEGMKPIESLRKDDEVMSYDRFTQLYTKSTVVRNLAKRYKRYAKLRVGDQEIETNKYQQFLREDLEWKQVCDLDSKTRLLTYNMEALPVEGIDYIDERKTDYILSLEGGPRNFAIGDKKLIAHNEPFTITVATVAGLSTVASLGVQALRAGFHGYLAWRGKRSAEQTLKEVLEYYTAQGLSEEMKTLTLHEIISHDIFYNLPRAVQDQLGRISNKYGVGARLSDCTLDEIAQIHVSGMLQTAAAAKHLAEMTPNGVAAEAHSAATRGAVIGAIGGAVQLTIGLATGNVESIGDAVNTIVQPALQAGVTSAALNAGTNIGFRFTYEVAPSLAAKALPYVPVVGTVYNCYTTVKEGYGLYKDVGAFLKNGKKPHLQGSKLPQSTGGGGSSSGGGSNGGGGGGRQGDAVKNAVSAVLTTGKVLSDNKDKVEKAGRIINKIPFSNFRKLPWATGKLENVGPHVYRIVGEMPGMPKGAHFIKCDFTHTEMEVFAHAKRHLGAWAATLDKLVEIPKKLDPTRVERALDGLKGLKWWK